MMESHTILVLVLIIACAFLLMFFLRQKKMARKPLVRQDPRFDLAMPAPAMPAFSNQEPSYLEQPLDEVLGDSLLEDPLLKPATTQTVIPKKAQPSIAQVLYFILTSKKDKPYVGYELLQSLLAVGLRFGPMDIFHRYEDMNGTGKILFSVASASEPGTFEINKIGAYTGKGLMMFLRLSANKDLTQAFNIMLETGRQLIEDLDGDILDDEREVLSDEKIAKMRKMIFDFEQKQLTGDLFDS